MSSDYHRRLAYHEAGHAVAALALGATVDYVTLRPSVNTAAAVAYSRANLDSLQVAIVSLAGPEAADLSGLGAAYSGASRDIAQALEHSLAYAGLLDGRNLGATLRGASEILTVAQNRARDLVSEYKPEIERGAAVLMQSPYVIMTGCEFARAVGGRLEAVADTIPAAAPPQAQTAVCDHCGAPLHE